MGEFKVYKHTTPSNKVYIGITKQSVEKRWQYGSHYKKQMFYRAIQKYGWNNIKHEVLFEGLEEKQAKLMEISLIHYYKSNNPEFGYNISAGGEGTYGMHTTGGFKKGNTPWNKDKKGVFSESTKEKMRIAKKGKSNHCEKPVIQTIIETGETKQWKSAKEASISLNRNPQYIALVIRRGTIAFGSSWQYL